MTAVFAFLQKGNKTKYNLVSETLVLLDVICGSTTGGLGLLGATPVKLFFLRHQNKLECLFLASLKELKSSISLTVECFV
jgi:hypothetical protein